MHLEYRNEGDPRKRRRWMLAGMLGMVVLGSVLPIWQVWAIGFRESNGRLGMLWIALYMLQLI